MNKAKRTLQVYSLITASFLPLRSQKNFTNLAITGQECHRKKSQRTNRHRPVKLTRSRVLLDRRNNLASARTWEQQQLLLLLKVSRIYTTYLRIRKRSSSSKSRTKVSNSTCRSLSICCSKRAITSNLNFHHHRRRMSPHRQPSSSDLQDNQSHLVDFQSRIHSQVPAETDCSIKTYEILEQG